MTPEERFRKSGGIRMVGNRRADHNPTYSPAGPAILPTTGKPMQRATPVVNSLMAKPAAKPAIKPTTQTQKALFGGQIKSMFPSLSPDLTRRRKARNYAVRSYSTLGA
jgi:hypothetical protein